LTGTSRTFGGPLSATTEPATRIARILMTELSRVIVGQNEVLEGLVIALLSGGHVLLEGPPGTAKTLMVHGLSQVIQARFRRVQFTPDLMPSDIVGTQVLHLETRELRLRRGPIFTDLLLADEINRAPAKTQAALLEAMGENQVTLDGETLPLSAVFLVAATQNPIEYEGTYPLPEAQLDRFMFKLLVDYPSAEGELEILVRHRDGFDAMHLDAVAFEQSVTVEDVLEARAAIAQVEIQEKVLRYLSDVIRRTREWPGVLYGGSPRAAVLLLKAARALAVLRDRHFIIPDDIKELAPQILRHRLVLQPEALIQNQTPDAIIRDLLNTLEVPR